MNDLAKKIHEKALECGFDNCGVISLDALTPYNERIQERLERFPASAPVYAFADSYTHLKRDYPWANSVVVCTEWFGKYKFPQSLQGRYAKAFILSAAANPECQGRRGKALFEQWLADEGIRFQGGETGMPARIMPLRQAAVAAGLGIFRKNNFFYGPKGSWYGLEGYLIDKSCEYIQKSDLRPCAENCGLCRKACKTCALSAPYTMNPLACVSFWTTFGGGNVPGFLKKEQFGAWILGCDSCQDACPYNRRHDWNEGEDYPGLDELELTLQPEHIVDASDDELVEKVLPCTEYHLAKENINVLRVNAKRTMEFEKERAAE